MKRKQLIALTLALFITLSFAACTKDEPLTAQTAEPEQPAAAPDKEPEEDKVVLIDGTRTDEPEQTQNVDGEQPLSDGEYLVKLERTQTVDRDGTVWASFVLLHYVELPDSGISGLKVGDTVQLPEYSFVIVNMQADDGMGWREIRFNDGTERCFYIEETNTWRFTWPSDEPYLIDGEHGAMPLAIDVILTDELTPLSEGRNVYGVPYDGDDPTIGALDSLEDFFKHYPGLESEKATVTVKNGEITEVLIEYHP